MQLQVRGLHDFIIVTCSGFMYVSLKIIACMVTTHPYFRGRVPKMHLKSRVRKLGCLSGGEAFQIPVRIVMQLMKVMRSGHREGLYPYTYFMLLVM